MTGFGAMPPLNDDGSVGNSLTDGDRDSDCALRGLLETDQPSPRDLLDTAGILQG